MCNSCRTDPHSACNDVRKELTIGPDQLQVLRPVPLVFAGLQENSQVICSGVVGY